MNARKTILAAVLVIAVAFLLISLPRKPLGEAGAVAPQHAKP